MSGDGIARFKAVKTAFENNYQCLGLTCSDVGGYFEKTYDAASGTWVAVGYYQGAAPCAYDESVCVDDTSHPFRAG